MQTRFLNCMSDNVSIDRLRFFFLGHVSRREAENAISQHMHRERSNLKRERVTALLIEGPCSLFLHEKIKYQREFENAVLSLTRHREIVWAVWDSSAVAPLRFTLLHTEICWKSPRSWNSPLRTACSFLCTAEPCRKGGCRALL